MSLDDIRDVMKKHEKEPGKREAQRALAHAVTELVHGRPAADAALRTSEILFGDTRTEDITPIERDMILGCAPTVTIAIGAPMVDVVIQAGLASSNAMRASF